MWYGEAVTRVGRTREEKGGCWSKRKQRISPSSAEKPTFARWDSLTDHLRLYFIHWPDSNAAAAVIDDMMIRIVQLSPAGFSLHSKH